ncbi:hypothetical protein BT96DRAFT_1010097 [Gymnopus androsaceus JB14]|uniref:Uncharacterized protein n=1 Tax=Gymnopus androsaceus JB14 TaxID=1447944 RepID=A0A6A4GB89_9AGAR|nr:hypothetical protein BT96DRAFT_1010097 [Gymnopus androsaceus JB14]
MPVPVNDGMAKDSPPTSPAMPPLEPITRPSSPNNLDLDAHFITHGGLGTAQAEPTMDTKLRQIFEHRERALSLDLSLQRFNGRLTLMESVVRELIDAQARYDRWVDQIESTLAQCHLKEGTPVPSTDKTEATPISANHAHNMLTASQTSRAPQQTVVPPLIESEMLRDYESLGSSSRNTVASSSHRQLPSFQSNHREPRLFFYFVFIGHLIYPQSTPFTRADLEDVLMEFPKRRLVPHADHYDTMPSGVLRLSFSHEEDADLFVTLFLNIRTSQALGVRRYI